MGDTGNQAQIPLPMEAIEAFCRKWHIIEFALFGSVLREDFRPDSDIDVLVTFAPDYLRSLADAMAMQDEIEAIFGRQVDLINRENIERSQNYIRRKAILSSARTIYVAESPGPQIPVRGDPVGRPDELLPLSTTWRGGRGVRLALPRLSRVIHCPAINMQQYWQAFNSYIDLGGLLNGSNFV